MKLKATCSLPQWPRGIIYEEKQGLSGLLAFKTLPDLRSGIGGESQDPVWELPQGTGLCIAKVRKSGWRGENSGYQMWSLTFTITFTSLNSHKMPSSPQKELPFLSFNGDLTSINSLKCQVHRMVFVKLFSVMLSLPQTNFVRALICFKSPVTNSMVTGFN